MLRGTVKQGIPYWEKLHQGKVTKFWLGVKIFYDKYYRKIEFSREKWRNLVIFSENVLFNSLI